MPGAFKPGNQFGKGNSFVKSAVAKLRMELLKRAKEGDIADIYDMLLFKALNEQDVVAARELLDRLIGPPKQSLELTGEDGGPVRHVHIDLTKLSDEQLESLRDMAMVVTADRDTEGKPTVDVPPQKLLEHVHERSGRKVDGANGVAA